MSDLISRQAAIDAMYRIVERNKNPVFYDEYADNPHIDVIVDELENLPSAEPETARIIVERSMNEMTMWYQCAMCNEPVDEHDVFCRGCGRRFVHE